MIGISLMYMEPIMLFVDVAGFLINQKKLMECISTMQELDDKLRKENIIIDYTIIKKITITLFVIISIFESSIVVYNYVSLQDTIWFAPLYVSTVSKVWYVALVYNIKQKFIAINLHFENMQKMFNENKKKINKSSKMSNDKSDYHDQIGYLHREIVVKKNQPNAFVTRRKNDILHVEPREIIGMPIDSKYILNYNLNTSQ